MIKMIDEKKLSSTRLLFERVSESPESSSKIAQEIFTSYLNHSSSSILLLQGEMGCGKTYFVQALGRYLGIHGVINSPTFNLLNIYSSSSWKLFHYDLYRIQNPSELDHLDFIERWNQPASDEKKCLHAIEWPEKAGLLWREIPCFHLKIDLKTRVEESGEKSRKQKRTEYPDDCGVFFDHFSRILRLYSHRNDSDNILTKYVK